MEGKQQSVIGFIGLCKAVFYLLISRISEFVFLYQVEEVKDQLGSCRPSWSFFTVCCNELHLHFQMEDAVLARQ